MRRRLEPLLFLLAGAAYLAAVARLAMSLPGGISGEAAILQGVSAEALAGTTPGRQALVGSAWWGPLPMLTHLALSAIGRLLPLSRTLPGFPLAVGLSALSVAGGCLWLLRTPLVTDGLGAGPRRPSVLLLGLAAVLPSALRLALGGSAGALIFPLALLVVLHGASWMATGMLRNLVPAGFAMAGLLLCGVEGWGWVLLGALLMTLGALRRAALARRLPGILLLGCLPALYAFGVWALLNWLIMEDGGFFLRILGTLPSPAWRPPREALPSLTVQVPAVICAGGVLLGLAARDARRAGFGLAGLAAAGWLCVLTAFGLSWSGDTARLLLGVCALLTVTRMLAAEGVRHRMRALLLQMILVLLVLGPLARSVKDGRTAALLCRDDGDAVVAQVREHVKALSDHPRVFVCGYEGLGLLRGDRRSDLFVPVLDLHLDAIRRDYWGQTLFVLVRKPVRRARMESILWRAPDFHLLGSSRTLLSADFGDWRLYEIVLAPAGWSRRIPALP